MTVTRARSYEVCSASNIVFAYKAFVTARESHTRRARSHEVLLISPHLE